VLKLAKALGVDCTTFTVREETKHDSPAPEPTSATGVTRKPKEKGKK
jgi:hypothetical protein